MPTLPLHTIPLHPGASHAVRSPGGFEWWYFDAQDPENDRYLVASFFDGWPFHPGYLRKFRAYLRNPTRHSPPLPRDYPCVSLELYEGGKLRFKGLHQGEPGSCRASLDRPEVRIGGNALLPLPVPWERAGERAGDSGRMTPLQLHLGPANLVFTPRWDSHSPNLYDVSGTIQLGHQQVSFSGAGHHNHSHGTRPLAFAATRWMQGRVLFDDAIATFEMTNHTLTLTQADANGSRAVPSPALRADWDLRTRSGLSYPSEMRAGEVIDLDSPRVFAHSLYDIRLSYRARICGREGRALCQIVHPPRLQNPVIGRLIERSFARHLPGWVRESSSEK